MAVKEEIITGRKWRRLIDKVAGLWQRISYWTHSTDVEFEDGKNAETKVGAIDGITDSLVSTSSNIAASAKALSQVNNNLAQGSLSFEAKSDGLYATYKVGADTVSKKLGSGDFKITLVIRAYVFLRNDGETYNDVSVSITVKDGRITGYSPTEGSKSGYTYAGNIYGGFRIISVSITPL